MKRDTARIPFANKQESGLEELAGASPIAHNVCIDRKGAVRRRPGLETLPGFTSSVINANGIVGVHQDKDSRLWAVSDGVVGKLYEVGSGNAWLRDNFPATSRPVFAETDAMLVVAAGQSVRRVILASGTYGALPGDPPYATHVVANAARLLLNNINDTSRVHYSDVQLGALTSGHEEWDTATEVGPGVFTGEARPDPVVALGENTSNVFVFGKETLQVFTPDGQVIYAPTSVIEHGCIAPYSVVRRDNQFAWLDHQHRFVVSDGRSIEVISDAVQKTLEDIETVSDCFGYRVRLGGYDFLVWTFPTDGRTFVFQEGVWGQWSLGDSIQSWARFPVTACQQRGVDAVVGTSAGKVGRLSLGVQTDFGVAMPAQVTTGYINHNTDLTKKCNNVKFSLRRGQASGSTAPVARFGWRDRPGGPWEADIPIDLGASGDTEIVVQFHGLGVYRRRQWFFSFNGTDDLTLVEASEEFEVQGS